MMEQMYFFFKLQQEETGIWFTICSKDGSSFNGAAGLNGLSIILHKEEVRSWVLPEYWGQSIKL